MKVGGRQGPTGGGNEEGKGACLAGDGGVRHYVVPDKSMAMISRADSDVV